ncbi:MAG: sulfotransferase family protein [Streptosporangiaceae bacterium]
MMDTAAARTSSRYAGASDRPVFIGACPRSGTTLLRTMLNCHPGLAMPRETRFLVDAWLQRATFGDLARAANRGRLAAWIFRRKSTTKAGRLEIDSGEAIRRLVAAPPTLGSLLGTCFLMYAEQQDKPRWGDKRPQYARYLDAIFAMFPDAQFINLVRDPRSSVASMRKLTWFDGDVVPGLELWERTLHAVDQWRRRLADDQLLEIRYEDLVGDPEATLGRVSSFLGLAPEHVQTMLSYHQQADVPRNKYHWRVSQPLTVASTHSFEETLSRDEIAFVEVAASAAMRRYSYEPLAHGAGVPAEFRQALRERRREKAKEFRSLRVENVKTRVTYRHPVAARLTSGQHRYLPR